MDIEGACFRLGFLFRVDRMINNRRGEFLKKFPVGWAESPERLRGKDDSPGTQPGADVHVLPHDVGAGRVGAADFPQDRLPKVALYVHGAGAPIPLQPPVHLPFQGHQGHDPFLRMLLAKNGQPAVPDKLDHPAFRLVNGFIHPVIVLVEKIEDLTAGLVPAGNRVFRQVEESDQQVLLARRYGRGVLGHGFLLVISMYSWPLRPTVLREERQPLCLTVRRLYSNFWAGMKGSASSRPSPAQES